MNSIQTTKAVVPMKAKAWLPDWSVRASIALRSMRSPAEALKSVITSRPPAVGALSPTVARLPVVA